MKIHFCRAVGDVEKRPGGGPDKVIDGRVGLFDIFQPVQILGLERHERAVSRSDYPPFPAHLFNLTNGKTVIDAEIKTGIDTQNDTILRIDVDITASTTEERTVRNFNPGT